MKDILDKLYQVRYSKEAKKKKTAIWKVLCREFLQKFIKEDDAVLDIAAGHCEFINNIVCGKKYAVDIDSVKLL